MFPTGHERLPIRPHVRDEQLVHLMIKPPALLAKALDQLRVTHGLSRKYGIDRFHITLAPLGDIRAISPIMLERIRRVVASVRAEPFDVVLNRIEGNALVGSRMNRLRDLQKMLVHRLAAAGVFVPDYGFEPHLSLCYTEWKPRNIPISLIGWRVETLQLINSVHGKGNELLDSWKLEPQQGDFGF